MAVYTTFDRGQIAIVSRKQILRSIPFILDATSWVFPEGRIVSLYRSYVRKDMELHDLNLLTPAELRVLESCFKFKLDGEVQVIIDHNRGLVFHLCG
jgi:hypothetical protein